MSELDRKNTPQRPPVAPASAPARPVPLDYQRARTQQQALESAHRRLALQQQHTAAQALFATPHARQRQAAAPVLQASQLTQHDHARRHAERTLLQRQIDILRTELPTPLPVQQQAALTPHIPPVFTRKGAAQAPPSIADHVNRYRYEMALQRASADRHGFMPQPQVAAIQHRIVDGLAHSYRTSSLPAVQRQRELAQHLASLQDFRHAIKRATIARLPAAERPVIQRLVEEAEVEQANQATLQRRAQQLSQLEGQLEQHQRQDELPIVQRVQERRGSGAPLPDATRRQLERGLNADFSGVRIHADGEAHQLSKSVGAVAFTAGHDVYFQRGKYDPASSEGQKLLAHELTHVLQQREGRVHGGGVDPDASAEVEAQQNAERYAARRTANVQPVHSLTYRPSTHAPSDFGFQVQRFSEEDRRKAQARWLNGAQHTGKFIKDFGTGFGKAGVETVKGLWNLGVGAAQGAWNLTGGWVTDSKAARSTWKKTLSGAKTVGNFGKDAFLASSPLALLAHPKAARAAQKRMRERGNTLWYAVKQPYVEAWKRGDYGEAIGRGTFEIAAALIGTKGLDKIGKAGKLGRPAKAAKATQTPTPAAPTVKKMHEAALHTRGVRPLEGERTLTQAKRFADARRAERLAEFERFKAEYATRVASQNLTGKELQVLVRREWQRQQIRGQDVHRLRYHRDAPTGRMAEIDKRAGDNYQRLLQQRLDAQEVHYRYTTNGALKGYREATPPRLARPTYMTDTHFPSNAESMSRAQVAKDWGMHEVGLKIPRASLEDVAVPRPFGGKGKLGWELFTHAYPEYGSGKALQFLAKTRDFDESWLFSLVNNYGDPNTKRVLDSALKQ